MACKQCRLFANPYFSVGYILRAYSHAHSVFHHSKSSQSNDMWQVNLVMGLSDLQLLMGSENNRNLNFSLNYLHYGGIIFICSKPCERPFSNSWKWKQNVHWPFGHKIKSPESAVPVPPCPIIMGLLTMGRFIGQNFWDRQVSKKVQCI